MAAPPLLSLQGIMLTFGGKPLLEGVDFSVTAGARLCLVGRNGSGKSTLLKIAAGEIEPDAGTRFMQSGASIRYLSQEPNFDGFLTSLGYVEAGLSPLDDLHLAQTILVELGMGGLENPSHLSGGEARRVALARALVSQPDILLLDEPTNHLDLPTILWLEEKLSQLRSALVLISHDRSFLQKLTNETLWIDRGRARHLSSGFTEFETWRDQELEEEEKQQHKIDRKIVAEEHWLRHGVSGRRKRNIKRLTSLLTLRKDRSQQILPTGDIKLDVSEAQSSGKLVIEAINLCKSFGSRKIVDQFSTRILRGDRVGIVGANGAGKTTLVNLLTGVVQSDSGKLRLGAGLEMATLEQSRSSLKAETPLQDALTGGGSDTIEINGERRHVIGYMKDFLFKPEQARTPIGKLSGGERGRLMLARVLAKPSNLLILDEPTNDLDLETLDLLEEMLADYKGTLILVSHDRDFLDRIASNTLMSEGSGRWIEYAGGYSDMVSQRGEGALSHSNSAVLQKKQNNKNITLHNLSPGDPPVKNKLTFNEQHALQKLPKKIEELSKKKIKLQSILDDSDLYKREPSKFDIATRSLAETDLELSAAEEKWLELEIKKESLGK